jgi:hypothetical protein
MLDFYCERLGPGLLAEPLNASSNFAFFIAAWAIWHSAQARQKPSPSIWLLISIVAAIGIGSLLFHTFATPWARFLDRTPILIFQVVFLWIYSRLVAGLGLGATVTLCVGFVVVAYFGAQYPHLLNGSLRYAPAILLLMVMGFYHYFKEKKESGLLLAAAGVFLLSLVFRTIDNGICPYFNPGTHFLWHLLNSVVLYQLLRGVVVNLPRSEV